MAYLTARREQYENNPDSHHFGHTVARRLWLHHLISRWQRSAPAVLLPRNQLSIEHGLAGWRITASAVLLSRNELHVESGLARWQLTASAVLLPRNRLPTTVICPLRVAGLCWPLSH